MTKLDIPVGTLEALLSEDGHWNNPTGSGVEKKIFCFAHKEDTPSMEVNVAKGLYYCFGCHTGGDAYTYLLQQRGLSQKQAFEKLTNEFSWTSEKVNLSLKRQAETERRRTGQPKIVDEPLAELDKAGKAVARYDYYDGEKLIVARVRYQKKPGSKKSILPFTPRAAGGFWMCGPMNENIPADDRIEQYPLYRLPELKKKIDGNERQIWIVEGEKCVDAVLGMQDAPKQSGAPPSTCLMGGSVKDIKKHDLTCLYGRSVLMIADQDTPSRDHMYRLGGHLHQNGCAVKYLLPKGETGYDIADVIAEGGWAGVVKWAKQLGGPKPHKQPIATTEPIPYLQDTGQFKVLGLSEDKIIIQLKATQEVKSVRRTHITSASEQLVCAPQSWWQEITNGMWPGRGYNMTIADALLRAAEERGQVDVEKGALGRGAAVLKDGGVIYNLGRTALCADKDQAMTIKRSLVELSSPENILTTRPEISVELDEYDEGASRRHTKEFTEAILRYRWHRPEYGRAFVGWIVSALIGGALSFRPMMWLLAPAGSGKTYLLEEVLMPIFGEAGLGLAETTAAGLRNSAKHDSLPCFVDEFEMSVESPIKRAQLEDVLKILRTASGGNLASAKADSTGGSVLTYSRFSALLSSIEQPRLSAADSQRLFPVILSPMSVPNWLEVQSAIEKSVTRERCLSIRTHIIYNTFNLIKQIRDCERNIMDEKRCNTRQAKTGAALTVGYRFMSGDDNADYIMRTAESIEDSEAYEPLERILSCTIRTETNRTISIAECLMEGYFTEEGLFDAPWIGKRFGKRSAGAMLAAKYGIVMQNADELWIAPSSMALWEIAFKGTKHHKINLPAYFTGIEGVEHAPARVYDGGRKLTAYSVPREIFELVGFFPPVQEYLGETWQH